MGRARLTDLPDELQVNVNTIVPRANELLEAFGSYRKVNSGYRRPEDNAKVPSPKPKSKHLTCQAVDLEDRDGKFKAFCVANVKLLESIGLWMEAPASTPTWVHVQCVPPGSKRRIFQP